MNGKHQAVAKEVYQIAAIIAEEAAFFEDVNGVAFLHQMVEQSLFTVQGKAEFQVFGCFRAELPVFEVGQSLFAVAEEVFRKEVTRRLIDLQELIPLGIYPFGRPVIGQHDSRSGSELAHRLDEADLLIFLQEGKYVATLAAGEALEDLLGLGDVERGVGILMERTQAAPIAARLLQRDVVLDDVHYVVGTPHLIYYLIVYHTLTTVTPSPPSLCGGVSKLITCFLRLR